MSGFVAFLCLSISCAPSRISCGADYDLLVLLWIAMIHQLFSLLACCGMVLTSDNKSPSKFCCSFHYANVWLSLMFKRFLKEYRYRPCSFLPLLHCFSFFSTLQSTGKSFYAYAFICGHNWVTNRISFPQYLVQCLMFKRRICDIPKLILSVRCASTSL